MGLRKETKLRTSFIRFVALLGASIIVLFVINYLLFVIVSNIAYPANYSEKIIQDNLTQLRESEKVTADLLTPMSSFGVYSSEGDYLYGNFSEKDKKIIWNKHSMEEQFLGLRNYITSINREDGILLIKYPLTVQYKSENLRSIFPNVEITIILLFFGELIMMIFLLSSRFAKKIDKELNSLLVATEKIENGDLDFHVDVSNMKEINIVLRGIDKMKSSLKTALKEQWIIEQQKREQISALAHDIKTPLTIVKGNIELLKETKITEEQKNYCKYIEESSRRMEKYIQSLLFIAKNDRQINSSDEVINIKKLLNCIKRQGEALCKAKNIHMVWKIIIEKDLLIKGNKAKLERALMNIISNAVDFSPKTSTVNINSFINKGKLIIQIIDQGQGFSERMLKHGTEQFAMEDKSRTKDAQHGLGLYIADNIIKKYNGNIILDNDANGGGFVTVAIPIINEM